MKGCELCRNVASTYCESDRASLCWDCDRKVHSANFLVANHSRSLLCHVCQSPTTWQGSGHILSLAFSLCNTCVDKCDKHEEREEEDAVEISESNYEEIIEDDEDEETGSESEDDCDDEDDDDGDNQVVPWSDDLPVSISSDEEVLKRPRDSQDGIGSPFSTLSPMAVASSPEALDVYNQATTSFSRPNKLQKTNEDELLNNGATNSRSVDMMLTTLRTLNQRDRDPFSAILAIRRITGDSEAL